MTAQDIDIRDNELEFRRLRFTIAHVGTQLGRNKTRLLLQAWAEALSDDTSPESQIMDDMNQEVEDATIPSGANNPAFRGDSPSVEE